MSQTVIKNRTEALPCELTAEELEARGQEIASLCQKIEEVETEKADTAKQYKDKLDGLEERRHHLAKVIRERAEDRSVSCQDLLIRDDRQVRTVRLDTGEEVRSRNASDEEMTRGADFFGEG